jgi:hypothetical protein
MYTSSENAIFYAKRARVFRAMGNDAAAADCEQSVVRLAVMVEGELTRARCAALAAKAFYASARAAKLPRSNDRRHHYAHVAYCCAHEIIGHLNAPRGGLA